MRFDAPVFAPFEIVPPEWIDYNGHLNMAYYNVFFDRAVGHALNLLGCGGAYVKEHQASFFTLETHVVYRREVVLGARLRASFHLLEHDDKRLRIFQELRHEEGWLSATSEGLLIHVDLTTRRASPFPDIIAKSVAAMAEAHGVLAEPERAGRSIALKRAKKTPRFIAR